MKFSCTKNTEKDCFIKKLNVTKQILPVGRGGSGVVARVNFFSFFQINPSPRK